MSDSPASHRPAALVTGASSGIGREIARILAARGFDAVLVARRRDRLEALAGELVAAHGVTAHVVAGDLAMDEGPDQVADEVVGRGLAVDFLVNSAGLGQFGDWVRLDPDQERDMAHVNIVGLSRLTRRFLPPMMARGRGRVLNVASTAAFFPGPLMAVYYASKAYVLSYSLALAEETRGTGVTVTCLCPGVVATGFQAVAGTDPSRRGSRVAALDAERVAREGVEAALAGKAVHVPGLLNKLSVLLPRLLPLPLLARAVRMVQTPTAPEPGPGRPGNG